MYMFSFSFFLYMFSEKRLSHVDDSFSHILRYVFHLWWFVITDTVNQHNLFFFYIYLLILFLLLIQNSLRFLLLLEILLLTYFTALLHSV